MSHISVSLARIVCQSHLICPYLKRHETVSYYSSRHCRNSNEGSSWFAVPRKIAIKVSCTAPACAPPPLKRMISEFVSRCRRNLATLPQKKASSKRRPTDNVINTAVLGGELNIFNDGRVGHERSIARYVRESHYRARKSNNKSTNRSLLPNKGII